MNEYYKLGEKFNKLSDKDKKEVMDKLMNTMQKVLIKILKDIVK